MRNTFSFDATGGPQPCKWILKGPQAATLFLEGLHLGTSQLSVYNVTALPPGPDAVEPISVLTGTVEGVPQFTTTSVGFTIVLKPSPTESSTSPFTAAFQSGTYLGAAVLVVVIA